MEDDELEDDYPCVNCDSNCDHWEARYCCVLCNYYGGGDCDDCDGMEIGGGIVCSMKA